MGDYNSLVDQSKLIQYVAVLQVRDSTKTLRISEIESEKIKKKI